MNKDRNITPYSNKKNREACHAIKRHLPAVLWFTGFSGSGKTAIANTVELILIKRYHAHTYVLDGDNLRNGLNADLGFSLEDRSENIRRVGEVVKLLADAGLIVLTAFISPLRTDRDRSRQLLRNYNFKEIFVDCPLGKCEERDTKGLYEKARAGEIPEFTGISSLYEVPTHPDLILKTAEMSIAECSEKVIEMLLEHGLLSDKQEVIG